MFGQVEDLEVGMASLLGNLRTGGGGGNLKAYSIGEVDTAYNAARTAIPAFTHAVFKARINSEVSGFGAPVIDDVATDDNTA
jgi:hypothetical protein